MEAAPWCPAESLFVLTSLCSPAVVGRGVLRTPSIEVFRGMYECTYNVRQAAAALERDYPRCCALPIHNPFTFFFLDRLMTARSNRMAKADRPETAMELRAPRLRETGRQPLYASLAQSLLRDIAQNRYPVGSLLPTEDAIGSRYGVSRHTVRQALRELKEEGVISSHPGIGTRVRAPSETPRVFGGINTIGELMQFAESTEMRVLGRREITADAAFAADYNCKPGQAWLQITLLRKVADQKRPLGHVQAYVRPEYADAVSKEKAYTRPLYALIEEHCGVRVVEVQQEITAVNLDAEVARALRAADGQAAMRITRYFLDRSGTTVEISVGHYPSGLYTQRSRFRAQRADRDNDEAAPDEAARPVARPKRAR
jgi:GntR family transcriptional regulator